MCWEQPYLVQPLFVISLKFPGAEIRKEEAFRAALARHEWPWGYKGFFC